MGKWECIDLYWKSRSYNTPLGRRELLMKAAKTTDSNINEDVCMFGCGHLWLYIYIFNKPISQIFNCHNYRHLLYLSSYL